MISKKLLYTIQYVTNKALFFTNANLLHLPAAFRDQFWGLGRGRVRVPPPGRVTVAHALLTTLEVVVVTQATTIAKYLTVARLRVVAPALVVAVTRTIVGPQVADVCKRNNHRSKGLEYQ